MKTATAKDALVVAGDRSQAAAAAALYTEAAAALQSAFDAAKSEKVKVLSHGLQPQSLWILPTPAVS